MEVIIINLPTKARMERKLLLVSSFQCGLVIVLSAQACPMRGSYTAPKGTARAQFCSSELFGGFSLNKKGKKEQSCFHPPGWNETKFSLMRDPQGFKFWALSEEYCAMRGLGPFVRRDGETRVRRGGGGGGA